MHTSISIAREGVSERERERCIHTHMYTSDGGVHHLLVYIHICIYIYIYVYTYVYVYIYIYRESACVCMYIYSEREVTHPYRKPCHVARMLSFGPCSCMYVWCRVILPYCSSIIF